LSDGASILVAERPGNVDAAFSSQIHPDPSGLRNGISRWKAAGKPLESRWKTKKPEKAGVFISAAPA
jgi:hypothetical protein